MKTLCVSFHDLSYFMLRSDAIALFFAFIPIYQFYKLVYNVSLLISTKTVWRLVVISQMSKLFHL
jgi:hypothetical protein